MSDDDPTTDGPVSGGASVESDGGAREPKSFVLEDLDGGIPNVSSATEPNAPELGNRLRVEFSAMTVTNRDIGQWRSGSLVTFDEPSSTAVRVFFGDKLVAHGEMVELDGQLGVRVIELMDRAEVKAA